MSTAFRQFPNIITGLRLLAAPLLAVLLLEGRPMAALGVFAFAAISDVADGFLAKHYGLATRTGRYLDPAADKILMLLSYLTLAALKVTPLWLTSLVIGRDVVIVAGIVLARLLELPLRVVPLPIGKASTAVQVCYIGLIVALMAFGIDAPRLVKAAELAVGALTLASGASYAVLWFQALSRRASRVA